MRLAFAALYLAASVLPRGDKYGVDAFAFSVPRFGSRNNAAASSFSSPSAVVPPRLSMVGAGDDEIGETDMGDLPAPKYVAKEGDDEYQGGQMFKRMMEAAKAGKRNVPRPQAAQSVTPTGHDESPPPPPPPPQAGSALVLHPGWSPVVDPASGQTYYYNQLTGETTWDAPVAPPPPPPPPPGVPPPPLGVQGGDEVQGGGGSAYEIPTLEEQFIKGVKGKRREFDVIANTADIYLAQLKRDSTVRNIARQEGDVEFANTAFGDESIKELEGWVQKNPHTEEKKEEWMMVGTSDDEELRFDKQYGHLSKDERDSYTGVSYKQKMAELKARKKKGGAGEAEKVAEAAVTETPEPVAETLAPAAEEPAPVIEPEPVVVPVAEAPMPVLEEPEPVAEPEPQVEEPPAAPAMGFPTSYAVTEPEPQAEIAEATPPAIVQTEAAAAEEEEPVVLPDPEPLKVNAAAESVPATPEPSTSDEGDKVRTLRTLMGLLLKHRGGPGFGKGILKGPEARRLEDTLSEATRMLREEAGMDVIEGGGAAAAAAAEAPAAPAVGPASALEGTFACVEGAVAQYHSSGESSLPDVRNALLAAVNSINRVLAENGLDENGSEVSRPHREEFPSAPPTAESGGEATGMGFPDSYAMTEPEAEVAGAGAGAGAVDEAPAMGFPDSYAVTAPEAQPQPEPMAAAAAGGDDPNTALLRGSYETLKSFAGVEKFGLKNLSVDEAAKLRDVLVDVRGVLMEELDQGLPDPGPPLARSAAEAAVATEVAVAADEKEEGEPNLDLGSMYKKKLAQAKVAKDAWKKGSKSP